MGAFIKRTVLGFSLLELMVVVAIIGVLATVAVPRFNIFRARTRQAEAKSNLGVIYTLQESFLTAHEQYYNGATASWGGTDMNTNATREGNRGGDTTTCRTNKLGFRLANCDKARYGYFIVDADEDEFLSVAYAESKDGHPGYRIFPGCAGSSTSTMRVNSSRAATGITVRCSTARDSAESGFAKGDAWCLDEGRNIENYRDITEHCGG